MSNLAKLDFMALDISGNNYLSWVLDTETHLNANGLGDTIKEINSASSQDKAKALIFIRRHLHEDLKAEYLIDKDPLVLWNKLKERFDHQKTVILPKAHYEWLHLRLQGYKSVSEYNSAMFRITSLLLLCGEKVTEEEMLEKTFSTFHASNVLLQQQYHEKGFKKYSELISCFLVAEQNNELLMKNHETRPSGSNPPSEVNAARYDNQNSGSGRGRECGHGHGRGRGLGRGYGHGRGRGNYGVQFKNTGNFHKRQERGDKDKGEIDETKKMHAIVAVEDLNGHAIVAHQSILLISIKNHSRRTKIWRQTLQVVVVIIYLMTIYLVQQI